MRVLLFAPALLLSACDPTFGVARRAYLSEPADLSCAEQTIRTTPGVATVKPSQMQGGRELTLAGVSPPAQTRYFMFEGVPGSGIQGSVNFTDTNTKASDQRYSFNITMLTMGRKPPQSQVDATRPVMAEIERRLIAQCRVAPLKPVREQCIGVSCPALAP